MTGKLAILPGDGVGPEVIAEARRVLDWVLAHRNFALDVTSHDFGLACYAKTGELMTPEMREDVMAADAVLFCATTLDVCDISATTEYESSEALKSLLVFDTISSEVDFTSRRKDTLSEENSLSFSVLSEISL